MSYYKKLLYENGGGITSPYWLAERSAGDSLFIGIGGTGCDVLSGLKRGIYSNLKPDNPDSPIPDYRGIEFLAVDSDMSQFRSEIDCVLDLEREVFDISHPRLADVFRYKEAFRHRRELDWLSYEELWVPANGLMGSGGVRQIGRYLLFEKAEALRERLTDKILQAVTDPRRDLTIHIVCGLSGGTGGGCFIDVCYLVRKILEDMGIPNARIMGYFFLPDVQFSMQMNLPAAQRQQLQANGYAALKELDYLMNLDVAKDCFSQNYGEFVYSSAQPPVDNAYLVSAVDSSGLLREDGYGFCTGMVADYLFSQAAGTALPAGADADAVMADVGEFLAGAFPGGHMGQEQSIRHGANYRYCVMGASKLTAPRRDVVATYLGARLFKEFEGMYGRRPGEDALKQFIQDNRLNYEEILEELKKGIVNDIEFPDFRPADIQMGNKPVVQVCDNWTAQMLGGLAVNSKALLKELDESFTVPENPVSLIGRLYKALDALATDPQFGPSYAKRMLYSTDNKNLIHVLDGYLARCREEKDAEERLAQLRRNELDQAMASFASARGGVLGKLNRKYREYLLALENWYLHFAKLDQLNELEKLLRGFRSQALALDTEYYNVLAEVAETLGATFAENYHILTESETDESSYAWEVFNIKEIRENLDAEVEGMNKEQELQKFLRLLTVNSGEWLGRDEEKITRLITSFMTTEFQATCSKSIPNYLQEKYQTGGPAILAAVICNEILMGQMDTGASPLFWKHPLFPIDSAAKHCVLSIPYNSVELKLAAGQFQAGQDECMIRETGLEEITLRKFYSGVPLFGYRALGEMEQAYESYGAYHGKGIHLYENDRNSGRDWRKYLPSPIPASVAESDGRTGRDRQMQAKAGAVYDRAMEQGVLWRDDFGDWYLRTADQFDLAAYKQALASCQENGAASAAQCDGRSENGKADAAQHDDRSDKIKEMLEHFYEQPGVSMLRLLDDGTGDSFQKAVVRRDNFIRFPVFVEKAQAELDKLDGLLAYLEEVGSGS